MQRVVIADDDEDLLEALGSFLEEEGYLVWKARDGVEAVALIQEHRPCIVVLDGVMPKLDGWQVLGRLAEDPEFEHMPVILTSGTSRSSSRRGDIVFMPKPIDWRLFLRVLRRLAGSRPTMPQIPCVTPAASEDAAG